jgi:hypothetical protein
MNPPLWGTGSLVCAALLLSFASAADGQSGVAHRIESRAARSDPLRERFTDVQLARLEKLNRANLKRLEKLPELVVPESWDADELAMSPPPRDYPSGEAWPKLMVVHLPGQLFGAYEAGLLVRWGPISSGASSSQTPNGLFYLTWRSTGHASSIDPTWFMRWYFNFAARRGLAFHEYSLPGLPASHGCIRLLQRDARWLYDWGEGWTRDTAGIVKRGTPVLIVGEYDFGSPPPWRSPEWLNQPIDLPPMPPAPDHPEATSLEEVNPERWLALG